ncbi:MULTISPECIES: SURF1 family protein [unclassified Pseudomonas]|uniref:SURF1 family protein n=1 Tax=unclassified Pseudomonas TaxID=196821 RepID=UPI002AC9090F|nr:MULTISPECIES: SURF1 family protein [unclassified Pseudomonas]MEB0039173.1 SURF1 family protein [Pseudomonas sp. MH10]MEB0078360.1 SURF1 family protein [Pseudomonas sp. MH10out]MEB0100230.1 SURF1 family protein [Pseudomonas sp. CCI3.2]MEB0130128.1 SURF1 family protein [Pseudomonas sp. CCI2.4]MEB0157616.1 SURF1 family protein [Pseudomonas sp. AH2 (2023)]
MKRFQPGVAPTLVVFLLLPLLIFLGFWQLDRGEQKRVLLNQYAERRVADPIASTQLEQTADPAYRRVQLRGQFDAAHSLMLDNSTRGGRGGIELIQPFHDQASGLWLWVNRGWLPWPDRRTSPVFTTPQQVLSLSAWVYVPTAATFQLGADPVGAPWPRLVTAVNPGKLWTELGRSGFADELRLEPGPAAYQLDWPIVAMGPEQNLGYAVQWFAMAVALFGLFLYLGYRNAKEKNHGSSHESTQHV